MKKIIFGLTALLIMTACTETNKKIVYPQTAQDNQVDNYFGTDVSDPYRWLENDSSAATEAWVVEQNKTTFDYLKDISFREDLKTRLNDLMNYPKYGLPFKKNDIYYYFKNDGLQNQSVMYSQTSLDAEPEVVLDPNKLSDDGTVALTAIEFSENGKYMAYSISKSGSDWNEIKVMNLADKSLLTDKVEWVKFSSIAWQGDGFYYSAYDAPTKGLEFSNKNEYHKVYYHALGTDQKADKLIFENTKHALRTVQANITDDEKLLFVTESETTSGNSLMMKDLTNANAQWINIVTDFDNEYAVVEHMDGKVFILSNYKAPKQQLYVFDVNKPQRENWKVLIAEKEDVLSGVFILGNKIVAQYQQDAASHVFIYNIEGALEKELNLPGIGTVSGFSGTKDDNEAFYSFTSFTYPPSIFSIDMRNNQSKLFRETEVKFNPQDFVTEQQFYESKDGTKIPMFITYKKGMKKTGKNPVMLYGYGGFNISINPSFNTSRLPFIEQGGIYVVANIRGGGEYGEEWHVAGTKKQKQNVFDDFIAAAEYLIAEGYTNNKKIAINGGSNGGLLIGACMTQRPDLFAVAIPEVGVLDMLRYQKFTIGWAWASDYGTSEESKEMFEYLKAFSPVHNVKAGVTYPATLIMTGDHDDRVVPAHSFKFAAALQAANNGVNPSLIRIDVNAGHGAGKPITKIIEAQTDMWAFTMKHLGMKPKF